MQLEPFKLERFFAQHEFSARHLLSCSDAEAMTVEDLLRFEPHALENLKNTWLGYTESTGSPELRQEIAKLYRGMGGPAITAEQVLLHTGAQEPIFNLMNAVLRPGDHVIVHFPSYQSLTSVPRAVGCEVSHWTARFEQEWKLDLDELEKLIRPQTKLVVVNCPHNPSGYIMPAADQMRLIEMLRKRGILLLSDEVYRGIELDPRDRLPAACELYENAISLGVLSKSYGLAGLRLGWIATRNSQVYQAMAAFKDYTTICNSVVSEALALVAIRHGDAIIARNLELVRENWNRARAFIDRYENLFEVVAPQGGTMIFPRAKAGFDVNAFGKSLLAERGAMLITGQYFDQEPQYFRLGLGRRSFPKALAEMEAHLGTFADL